MIALVRNPLDQARSFLTTGRGAVMGVLALAFTLYVGFALSPSSYALALRQFNAPDDGLVLGQPRLIRSDEWAVITPLTQATVNNGFGRMNRTSFYGDDLRSNYSLPIKDWGLAFKPTQWGFLFAHPARAFSAHHALVMVLFIAGYWFLFEALGMSWGASILLSLSLYFAGFTQYWWTTIGPPLAFFPWVMWIVLGRGPLWWRAPLLTWLTASWLLSSFYPPLFIPQAFLALVMLVGFRPDALRWKNLFAVAAAAGIGALIAVAYLHDWLQASMHTVYPGARRATGGGFGWERTIAQFFPSVMVYGHQSLWTGVNICEASVVGSFYLLMATCFLDLRGIAERLRGARLRAAITLAVGFVLLAAWLYLPLPSWAGAPLLWNFVVPVRMAFASGFLLLLLTWTVASAARVKVTLPRVAVFAGVVLAGWWYWKLRPHGLTLAQTWVDVVIVAPVAVLLVAKSRFRLSASAQNLAMLGAAVAVAALTFGNFNPLQRAWPIFDRPTTDVSRWLDAQAARFPDRRLAVGTYSGAILNGWGYASASHVLTAPRLDFFRKMFPHLPEEEINRLFNRYEHIALSNEEAPRLLGQDAVLVPEKAFLRQGVARISVTTVP